ncbi:MAG TPA: glycosyltransferase, partial [Prosthecobacter sp.]
MPEKTLDQVVQDQVLTHCTHEYVGAATADLVTKQNLDPFGLLNQVSTQPLGDYNFSQVTPDKAADFLARMDLRAHAAVPAAASIPPGALTADATTVYRKAASGNAEIPRLQHSIWVGKPLDNVGGTDKMKSFMAQLAANQRSNDPANNGPNQNCTNAAPWQVVLWTDQPRAAFCDPGDPAVANMKQWAADNNIRLVSIDEVFGDPANRMQLHTECRLEQNKAGTGRAAASDIIRLEVLNRFGGVYVDGDKPFRKDLDEIAEQAVAARVSIGGVPTGGFVSAVEGVGRVQNCGLCSEQGGAVVQAVLNHIGVAYTQDRNDLVTSQGNTINEGALPQRIEVITRSGPSAIQAVTAGNGLMTADSLQSYTGTTSWTQEEPHRGYKQTANPAEVQVAGTGRLDDDASLQAVAALAPALPALPAMAQTLSDEQQTKIAVAIKGGVTSLAYTLKNEAGRLDLRHLSPHMEDFSDEEKQIAIHGTVQALNSPAFAGMKGQINSLIPPTDVAMTSDTLDTLTTPGNFPGLKLDDLTMQRAALRGDVALLKYGAEHGVSLEAGSAQM